MPTVIQVRRADKATWSTTGVTLAAGEVGYETDTGNFKVGDGTRTWNDLAYQMPYINTGSLTNGKTSTVKETLVVNHETDRVGIGTDTPAQKLDVVGTAAISGNTTIGGTLSAGATTLSGDLAVNAATNADITTTTTTATLFNTNATTLNIGGAATAVSIGAATGTTTINNATTAITNAATVGGTLAVTGNTTLTGNLAVNGGNITTSSATATVFNSGATTLNVGQAATTVSIGANASGTATIRNATTAISGNATIAGTLGVTNATTFNASTGAPSYAADPASANVLSRKSYVDSQLRIGGVVVITAAGGTYPTIGGVFPSAINPGFDTAGLTGVPSGWTATLTGGNLTVAATGGTWFGALIKRQNDGNSGIEYGYLTGTSQSVWGGLSTFVALTLILVRTA